MPLRTFFESEPGAAGDGMFERVPALPGEEEGPAPDEREERPRFLSAAAAFAFSAAAFAFSAFLMASPNT